MGISMIQEKKWMTREDKICDDDNTIETEEKYPTDTCSYRIGFSIASLTCN